MSENFKEMKTISSERTGRIEQRTVTGSPETGSTGRQPVSLNTLAAVTAQVLPEGRGSYPFDAHGQRGIAFEIETKKPAAAASNLSE